MCRLFQQAGCFARWGLKLHRDTPCFRMYPTILHLLQGAQVAEERRPHQGGQGRRKSACASKNQQLIGEAIKSAYETQTLGARKVGRYGTERGGVASCYRPPVANDESPSMVTAFSVGSNAVDDWTLWCVTTLVVENSSI